MNTTSPRYAGLDGKVVLITGGANGIGRSMASAFASQGARLMLLDVAADALAGAAAEIGAGGAEVESVVASVSDENEVEAAIAQTVDRFGRLDVLLNNAGISMNRPAVELRPDDWRRTVDINLTGVFLCAQVAGRRMIAQGSGVVINTSSMYGKVAAPGRAAYCATKAAVVSLTEVLAIEWACHGVRVNAIGPGYTRTAMVGENVQAGRLDVEALVKRTPMGRLGEPDEMAELSLFLASDSAAFITGQTIVADGGWTAYGYL